MARMRVPASRPRRWFWVAVAVVVVAVAAGGAAVVRARLRPPALAGAVLTPPAAAYDFRLRDVDGRQVAMSGLRGKVVVLTFLYTHCPDVCPLIAELLHRTYGLLGPATAHAAFVAVSVDPNGDTVAAVRGFLHEHHVQGELTYLRGTFAELRPVWAHYYVGSDAKEVNPAAAAAAPPAAGQVGHTAIVYVVDPAGKIRVFLSGNFDPQDLATDVKALAAGR